MQAFECDQIYQGELQNPGYGQTRRQTVQAPPYHTIWYVPRGATGDATMTDLQQLAEDHLGDDVVATTDQHDDGFGRYGESGDLDSDFDVQDEYDGGWTNKNA